MHRVVLDDGTVMRLYRQTIEDFGLFPGLELTDSQMEKLRTQAGAMSAKMRAVRIVSAANVSKKGLEQRLIRKGEDPEQAKEAVQWMSNLNLLDDTRTARQIVEHCVLKGYGPARAKQALYEKQIPREIWDDVLADYPDQTNKMVEFLKSRLGDAPEQKEIKRATDALMRRGHSWNSIRRALNQVMEDQDFQEDM